MSEEKKVQFCSSETPADLIRTLNLVKLLATGTDEEVLKVPFVGRGETFQDALNVAQHACPKVDWIRKARVRWLMLGIKALEEQLDRMKDEKNPETVNFTFSDSPALGMHHRIFDDYLTVGHLGSDCYSVMDQYLELLAKVGRRANNLFWGQEMVKLIYRRTGFSRPDDPHRDVAACDMFMRKYELLSSGYFIGV